MNDAKKLLENQGKKIELTIEKWRLQDKAKAIGKRLKNEGKTPT